MQTLTANKLTQHRALLNSSSALRRAALLSLAIAVVPGKQAFALPTGGEVKAGTININQPDAHNLVINQTTDRGVIDWKNFDILHGETTRFNQNNANSITLNRVTDGNPTQIYGNLIANGRIIVQNGSGVHFGPGSKVDVGGLIATTADTSNASFMAGQLNFNKAGKADASIVNQGSITAAQGGLVALVAPGVRNDGVISAQMGTVKIGSAQTVAIDMYGDNLYSFSVGQKTDTTPVDQDGKKMDSVVENNGAINAQRVYITANAAKGIVNNVINNTGIIEASSARVEGGTIVLDGGEGNVHVAGTVRAAGKNAGQKGGTVTVTGKNIQLASATIDASGIAGGGSVKIGGDAQGAGTLAHADSVSVDADSTIDVSATEGNGGSAVVWSDGLTTFAGILRATGLVGGEVETSGHDLAISGTVDVADGGSWLLDPMNVLINAAMATTINGTLNGGGDVNITTNGGGAADGNITVAANILKSAGNNSTLSLKAHNDITVNSGVSIKSTNKKLNVELVADKDGNHTGGIALNSGSSITSNGGNITLGGDSGAAAYGDTATVNAYGGNTGVLINNATVDAGAGDIAINGHGGSNAQNAGVLVYGTGALKTTSGNITVTGTGGDTAGYGAYGVLLGDGGNITTQSGNIVLNGTGGATGGHHGYGNGIQLYNSSSILSNGNGKITLNGTANGPASEGNYGIYTTAGNNLIGGSSDTGNVILNSTGSVDLSNNAIKTQGTVTGNIAGDYTAHSSNIRGGNVNLASVGNVNLLGTAALWATTGNLTLNNSGAFHSDNANSLTATNGTASLRQSQAGVVQNAINAIGSAAHSLLTLGNGTWNEQLDISKSNFTLTGNDANSVIQAPAVMTTQANGAKPIVLAHDADGVTISHLKVDGAGVGNSNFPLQGIAYNNAGGAVEYTTITNVTDSPFTGVQHGNALVALANNGTARTLTVDNNTIDHFQKNGMRLEGADLTVNVHDNTVTGVGSTTTNAQNGIVLINGANGVIDHNTISGIGYSPADASASAILAVNGGSNITVSNNTIDAATSGYGITAYKTDGMTISGNKVNNADIGIDIDASNKATLTGNKIDTANIGILLEDGSNKAIITGGKITGTSTGIDVEGSNSADISDVKIDNHGIGGAVGILFDGGSKDGTVTGGSVKGGTMGVDIYDAKNTTISGVKFADLYVGINAVGAHIIDLGKNIMENVANGIFANSVTGDDKIHGNTFTLYNGQDAIHLVNSNGADVKNNDVDGGAHGVWLEGSNNATISGGHINNANIGILADGSKNVTINGDLSIDGGSKGNQYGIELLNSDGTVSHTTISNIGDTPFSGAQHGIGIFALSNDGTDRLVTLDHNTISGFQKNGMRLEGANLDVDVNHNTITGHGDTTTIAQNGIVLINDVNGTVDHNDISGISYSGADAAATGILAYNAGNHVTISNNTIDSAGAGYGIAAVGTNGITLDSNKVSNADIGIDIDNSKNATLTDNKIDTANTGILVEDGSNGATITGGKVKNATVGIEADGSKNLTIDGVKIDGGNHSNLYGIKLTDSSGTVTHTTITNIGDTPFSGGQHGIGIYAIANDGTHRDLTLDHNTIDGFQKNGMRLEGADLKVDVNHNTITGAGDTTTIAQNGIVLINGVNGTVDHNDISGISYSGADAAATGILAYNAGNHVTISHNTIDSAGAGYGIAAVGTNDITLESNKISNADIGIDIDNSKNATLTDNKVDTANTGILVEEGSNHATITDGHMNNATIGIEADDSKDLTIDGTKINGGNHSNQYGIKLVNTDGTVKHTTISNIGDTPFSGAQHGIGIYATINDGVDRLLTFAHNTISDFQKNGMRLESANLDVDVNHNTITGKGDTTTIAQNGIVLINGVTGKVDHNDISGISYSGADAAATGILAYNAGNGIVISHNTIDGAGNGYGIAAVGTNGITIKKNDITNADIAIDIDGSNKARVTDNTISQANTGILVEGSSKALVAGGSITDTDHGVTVHDSDKVLVAGIDIDGGKNGITVNGNSEKVLLLGNRIRHETNAGVKIHNADKVAVIGNRFSHDNTGVEASNSSHIDVIHNRFRNDQTGISFDHVSHSDIAFNNLQGRSLGETGITLHGGSDVNVHDNTITGYAHAIDAKHVGELKLVENTISDGNTTVKRSDGVLVKKNHITNGDIFVAHSDDAVIRGNDVTGGEGIGITLKGSQRGTIENNTVMGRTLGYLVRNVQTLLFTGNKADGNQTGAQFAKVSNGTFSDNKFRDNELNGVEATKLDGATFDQNHFRHNGADGLNIADSSGVVLTGNHFVRNGRGVVLTNTNGTTLTGDIFTNNVLGLDIIDSANTYVDTATFTIPNGGVGIRIFSTPGNTPPNNPENPGNGDNPDNSPQLLAAVPSGNSSSGTIVRNSIFNGGDIAILLDGAGSSMQFADNGSTFDGMNYYFVLQNGAQFRGEINASQQTFAGVRGVDFTYDDLVNAEAKTIDRDDNNSLGNVFYSNVQAPVVAPAFDVSALDEFQRPKRGLFRQGLFSYAGKTLANPNSTANVEPTKFTYSVGEVQLSLLNGGNNAQNTTALIANRFANLAPAAGGKHSAADYANLKPAAGGTPNAQQLASLAPAAGGASGGCGNSFLGAGFEAGFSCQ